MSPASANGKRDAEDIWVVASTNKVGQAQSGLSSLASKVPAVKRVPDQQEMNRRSMARAALVKTVDFLVKNPSAAMCVWTAIEGRLIPGLGSDGALAGRSQHHSELKASSFGKLPADFIAKVFMSLDGGPSKAVLDAMDSRDADAIHDVGTFMFQLRRGDPLPKVCSDPVVCAEFLRLRLAAVGPRVTGWFQNSVAADGVVLFDKVPLHSFVWQEKRLVSVRHICGEEATLPQHVTVTDDFLLENAHDDHEACLVKAPTKLYLRDLFGDKCGPNKHIVDKRGKCLDALAAQAVRNVETAATSSSSSSAVCGGTVLQTRKRELRETALAKAREALAQKPKKSRSMNF